MEGLRDGWPSRSSSQPSGIDLPSAAAAKTFPPATVLVAMSSITGNSFPAGAAKPQGLLPMIDPFAPGALTVGMSLAIEKPIMFSEIAIEA